VTTAAPAYSIMASISRLIEREIRQAGVGLVLGQVTDARTPLVRVQGYDGASEVLLPDWFDVVPLHRGDLLVLGQLAGGELMVLARLASGSVSAARLEIDPDQITVPVVQAGSPFTDDGDEVPAKAQSSESAPIEFEANTMTPVTWTYTDAYSAPPAVFVTISAAPGDVLLSARVSEVTETAATIQVRNDHASDATATLVVLALGAV
jgi:hypothetical protein